MSKKNFSTDHTEHTLASYTTVAYNTKPNKKNYEIKVTRTESFEKPINSHEFSYL